MAVLVEIQVRLAFQAAAAVVVLQPLSKLAHLASICMPAVLEVAVVVVGQTLA